MFKHSLTGIFLLFWVALAIDPVDRGIWALENLLVVTVFPVVLWLDSRYSFSNAAYLSLTTFVILHLFGANLTYESMTYFSWYSDWFGGRRNYYDQVVHLLFGLMVFVPFFQIFHHQGISQRLSCLLAFLFITSISAGYEILEWVAMATFCRNTELACAQALTQGDVWDAQKDMAYAMAGALLALGLHRLWGKPARTHIAVRINPGD